MTEMNKNIESMSIGHLFRLTDCTGMFQHCKFGVPDPTKGYTTDDNARALIVAVMLYERERETRYLELIYRYTSFLLNAQNESGKFRNFMAYNRQFLEPEGSEDCFGRCLWALGVTLSSKAIPQNIKKSCGYMIERALPNVNGLSYIRGMAYSILGLSLISGTNGFKCDVRVLLDQLADRLVMEYHTNSDNQWHWFEDALTYCNGVLPTALFAVYRISGNKEYLAVAQDALEFLEKATFQNGYFKPVGCKGWMPRGEEPAPFDEQPVEACEMVLAYLEGYKVLKRAEYLKKALQCFEWYNGLNSIKTPMIDDETGGCFDGITPSGVNLNEGAESIISYLMAGMSLEEVEKAARL